MSYELEVVEELTIAGRYVEDSVWEAINHLGELRMILDSYGVPTDGRPLIALDGLEGQGPNALKGLVGFVVRSDHARSVLFHLKLEGPRFLKTDARGGFEAMLGAARYLSAVAGGLGLRAGTVIFIFRVNPLDYPDKYWSADVLLQALEEPKPKP